MGDCEYHEIDSIQGAGEAQRQPKQGGGGTHDGGPLSSTVGSQTPESSNQSAIRPTPYYSSQLPGGVAVVRRLLVFSRLEGRDIDDITARFR